MGWFIGMYILQIAVIVTQFYFKKEPKKEPQQKVDKYEDYRDPATGRLKGKKVGL